MVDEEKEGMNRVFYKRRRFSESIIDLTIWLALLQARDVE